MGFAAVVVVGLAIAFWFVHQNGKQSDANDALSKLTSRAGSVPGQAPTPDAFLKVAADFPGTDAGMRALLLGASELFAAGKYDEALAQFQNFLREHGDSAFAPQAALGVAASFDAQGKTNDATAAYQSVVDRYQNENVAPQAKLALARLLQGQGKLKEARNLYEELARSYPGTISSEAARRFQELNAAHPELIPTNPATATNQLDQILRSAATNAASKKP